ncbi:MAG: KH domain-containing protein [Deltaproteobacteria bacterium]|nr:KH domain-containing protein [Deltaproteobacteria bacterium]
MSDDLTIESGADPAPGALPLSDEARLALEAVKGLVQHMGLDVEARCTEEAEQIRVTLTGEDESLLIGKKGQTLDALQFMANKMLGREGLERRPVMVDAAGYRDRRADSLVQLAQRLCEKAQRTGKTVALNPMSPRDRRIIHMALKDTPGVTTRSEGEGLQRRLLIVPEN